MLHRRSSGDPRRNLAAVAGIRSPAAPIAPPATKAESYEIKHALLNLVMKEQFSSASTDDAAYHLNNFVELCDMQKYKEVESDIINYG